MKYLAFVLVLLVFQSMTFAQTDQHHQNQSSRGPRGPRGFPGPPGKPGPMGPAGPMGPSGLADISIVSNSVTDFGDLSLQVIADCGEGKIAISGSNTCTGTGNLCTTCVTGSCATSSPTLPATCLTSGEPTRYWMGTCIAPSNQVTNFVQAVCVPAP